jgi:hypothetical protein
VRACLSAQEGHATPTSSQSWLLILVPPMKLARPDPAEKIRLLSLSEDSGGRRAASHEPHRLRLSSAEQLHKPPLRLGGANRKISDSAREGELTAEVAISNKSAVVVAADSAVTVGKNRVHQHANKIFSISDAVPLGLMVYGYAEHCGIPWETVAKLFRQRHGKTKFKTVDECYAEFRKFLAVPEFFTTDAAEMNLLLLMIGVASDVYLEVSNKPRRSLSAEIDKAISRLIDRYENAGRKLVFSPPKFREFKKKASEGIDLITGETFKTKKYVPTAKIKRRFGQLMYRAICSSYLSDYSAGVVIFGFGMDELLPAIHAEEFDGSSFGSLRSCDRQIRPISQENSASVVPFADRNMMDVFMDGINLRTKRFFGALMQISANQIAERVIKDNFTLTDDQYGVVKAINTKAVKEIIGNFRTAADKWIREKSAERVLEVIKTLPKEDMAALAEALVEVTALKSKVSDDVESVGGAVDVCVVTKGDGLIWIKRKHYFEMSHNQQYLYRRFGNVAFQ